MVFGFLNTSATHPPPYLPLEGGRRIFTLPFKGRARVPAGRQGWGWVD